MDKLSEPHIQAKANTKEKIQFGNFKLHYDNLNSAEQIISGLANFTPKTIMPDNKTPFIIDAGSNIGITSLYFKSLYPQAKLLCFEPDPHAFALLQQNISQNKILNIRLLEAALSSSNSEIDFFGQIFVESPDARGNSIIKTWGLQRAINNTTRVTALKLSSFIDAQVDFLKLNIEGAEQQVIEDLHQANKLRLINELAIEVHQATASLYLNDVEKISQILIDSNFAVEIIQKDKSSRLPAEINNWVARIKPQFFSLRAVLLS